MDKDLLESLDWSESLMAFGFKNSLSEILLTIHLKNFNSYL